MPVRRKDEPLADYVGRCIDEVRHEGTGQKQAVGKCYGMADWKPKKKKKAKKR